MPQKKGRPCQYSIEFVREYLPGRGMIIAKIAYRIWNGPAPVRLSDAFEDYKAIYMASRNSLPGPAAAHPAKASPGSANLTLDPLPL